MESDTNPQPPRMGYDVLASLVDLPKRIEKCSTLEKSRIYQEITLDLITECKMHSGSQLDVGIASEIDRISIRIDDLIVTRRRLEAKNPWNIKNILKAFEMHRRRHIVLEQSSDLMNLARLTSESILRRRISSLEERESIINTVSSFLTAADYVADAQNDAQVNPEDEDHSNEATPDSQTDGILPQSSVNQDQSEQSTLRQIFDFVKAIVETVPAQREAPIVINMPIHIYQKENIVTHQDSGSCSTPTVMVGGSSNTGGGIQYTSS